MSLTRNKVVHCPQCRQTSEFTIWDSINVFLDPEMRDELMKGNVFRWVCPHCGKLLSAHFDTLYHDPPNKFMVYLFYREVDEDKKYDLSHQTIPDKGLEYGYSFRVVYEPNRLLEKIRIFEQGLNDIAIEKMKYIMTHYVDTTLIRDEEKLFFEKIIKPEDNTNYGRMVFHRLSINKERKNSFSVSMKKYEEQCQAIKMDKRFEANSWLCVDEGWIARQLKELSLFDVKREPTASDSLKD